MPINEVWHQHSGSDLQQGDVLERCQVLVLSRDFAIETEGEVGIETRRLIVVTQSCDLANGKAPYVALSVVYSLSELEQSDSKYRKRGFWESVRRNKVEGLYMLPSVNDPTVNREAFVVDFRMIISLPIGYLSRHADGLGGRPRLQSPYVEHFSQSFARFFMRVGLPSQIPEFIA